VGSPAGQPFVAEADGQVVLNRDGTLKNFYVSAESGLDSGPTFTVYKNGSATALTVSFTGFELALADDTHTVAVSRGDKIAVKTNFSGIGPTHEVWASIKYA